MHARLPAIAMFTALGGACLMFVVISVRMLAFWYPIDPGEGVLLDEVLRLSRGEGVFAPVTAPPYYLSNYPPLFVLVQVPFAWLFGAELWYGRLISQLSALVAAAFIGGALFRLTEDRLAAWTGGLTLLAVPLLVFWAQVTRVDLLALALGWAGIFLAFEPRKRHTAAAVACVVAAGYTRQTAWLPPLLAITAHMLATRGAAGRHDAGVFALAVGGAGLALMALFHVATDGWFGSHVVGVRSDQWISSRLVPGFAYAAVQLTFALPAAVAALVLGLIGGRRWGPAAAAYFVAAIAMGALVVKRGSHINYFVELGAATAVLSGLAISLRHQRPWFGRAVMLLLALQGLWAVRVDGTFRPLVTSDLHVLRDRIGQAKDPVISDAGLGLIPLTGHRLYFDPYTMTMAEDSGRWDAAPLMRDIRERRVNLIAVLRTREGQFPFWTPRLIDLVQQTYRECARIPLDDGSGGHVVVLQPACLPAARIAYLAGPR